MAVTFHGSLCDCLSPLISHCLLSLGLCLIVCLFLSTRPNLGHPGGEFVKKYRIQSVPCRNNRNPRHFPCLFQARGQVLWRWKLNWICPSSRHTLDRVLPFFLPSTFCNPPFPPKLQPPTTHHTAIFPDRSRSVPLQEYQNVSFSRVQADICAARLSLLYQTDPKSGLAKTGRRAVL